MKHKSLFISVVVSLLITACSFGQRDSNGTDIEGTLASQATLLAHLATSVAGQEQANQSQWNAIGHLATQMPLALGMFTPIPPDMTLVPTMPQTIDSPTPYPLCTPPACAPDEMYYCPGECPGGCGTTCATATPGVSPGFGQVWGDICYPDESSPAMNIYFQNLETEQLQPFHIQENQTTYRFELPAGVYVAFALVSNHTYSIGTYSEYVVCGLGDNCTDHTQVPFLVRDDHVTIGVDICDWYTDTQSLFPT
jgi:hypothetical protein